VSTPNTKKIGVATATIVGMNAMIGSGIFTAPATLASHVGPAGILAYLFVVPASWFMALALARVAQLFPQEGSFYTYAKQWSGHVGGLCAITGYFIGLLIAMGLLAQMAGAYLVIFFPSWSPYILGITALWILVLLNMFGVALSELGQHILIVFTIFPLIATTLICLAHANFSYLVPFAPYGYIPVIKAVRVVVFSFFGFECAASLTNIVRDPQKNVPKALTYSMAIVATIYTLFVFSLILSIPLKLFISAETPLSQPLSSVFPTHPWLITIIHISILSAIIGTIHSMIWTSSHLLVLIIKKLKSAVAQSLVKGGMINQKSAAFIVGLCIFTSYVTISNPDLFFYLTAVFIVFAYAMSMITLLTIKSEWKGGKNIKTLCGLSTAFIIFIFALEGLLHQFISYL
jgi:basic amino acid/polyamine antiporter, APA family